MWLGIPGAAVWPWKSDIVEESRKKDAGLGLAFGFGLGGEGTKSCGILARKCTQLGTCVRCAIKNSRLSLVCGNMLRSTRGSSLSHANIVVKDLTIEIDLMRTRTITWERDLHACSARKLSSRSQR